MRDDRNVIKITNSKKNIGSTKNGSYHLDKFCESYLWIWSIAFESWKYSSNMEQKIKKILQKMIKIIIKASKVSKRNMIKSLNIVKKFMRMLRIMLTGREKSI